MQLGPLIHKQNKTHSENQRETSATQSTGTQIHSESALNQQTSQPDTAGIAAETVNHPQTTGS